MINIKLDTINLNKVLKNSVNYSFGFIEGAQTNKILFNTRLGEITVEALKRFIDSKARMSPESLHHVYEWNMVGSPGGRLFELNANATNSGIFFSGMFLPSKTVSEDSTEPFTDKANVMENKISVFVEPKDSDVLAFDVEGQTIFTVNSVFIENPGGDQVAGSFGQAIDEFFDNYFTTTLLRQSGILDQLRYPREYSKYFSSGARAGRAAGISAGQKYMNISGGVTE